MVAAATEEMLPSGDLPRDEENIPDRLFPAVDLENVEWSCSVERTDPPAHTFPTIGRIHVLGQVLKIVNDEHKLTKEYIGKHCGGHRYRLNLYVPSRKKRGPYDSDKITCPGDPAFPSPEYIQRQVANGKINEEVLRMAGQGIGGFVGGNGAGLPVSTAESNLASKVVTTAESRADKLQQANEKLQAELREKAAKEAEISARFAALEQQLKVEQGHRAVEPELQRNSQEHERGMLGIIQDSNRAQVQAVRDAADARIAALEQQANRRESSEAKAAEAATAPMRQFMEDMARRNSQDQEAVAARHVREMAAAEKRTEAMLKIYEKQAASSEKLLTMQLEARDKELVALRSEKGKGLKEQITEIAAIVTAVKELGGLGGGDEKQDMTEKLIEGFTESAEHLPGILNAAFSGIRTLVTGQPVPMGGYTAQIAGQGAPPGSPEAPQAESELTPEQAKKREKDQRQQELEQDVELILDALVSGLQRDTSPKDLAGYMLNKHERAAMQLAAITKPEELDALVAHAQQRRPPLGSVAGDKYIRAVLENVRGQIN